MACPRSKFAWPSLLQALAAREDRIATDLSDAEKARQDGEAALAEYKKQLEEARGEARRIVEDARAKATQQQDEILAKGREDVEAMVSQAQQRIRQEAEQALNELYARTATLATDVASRIVQRTLRPEDHQRLVDQTLAEYKNAAPSSN